MKEIERILSNIEDISDVQNFLDKFRDELLYKGVLGTDDQVILTNREGTSLLDKAGLPY